MDHQAPTTTAFRPLAELLADDEHTGPLAVTLVSGIPLIVLGRTEPDCVDVFCGGRIAGMDDSARAAVLTDTQEIDQLIGEALQALQTAVNQAHNLRATIDELHEDTDRISDKVRSTQDQHAATLADIRLWAIEQHAAHDISADVLDAFLSRFAMPAYQPRTLVEFRITGSYEVDSRDGDTPRHAEMENICVDVCSKGFLTGTNSYTVTITSIEDIPPDTSTG